MKPKRISFSLLAGAEQAKRITASTVLMTMKSRRYFCMTPSFLVWLDCYGGKRINLCMSMFDVMMMVGATLLTINVWSFR